MIKTISAAFYLGNAVDSGTNKSHEQQRDTASTQQLVVLLSPIFSSLALDRLKNSDRLLGFIPGKDP